MGGIAKTGVVAYDNAVLAAEATRQSAVAAATTQAATNTAEVTYSKTQLAAALANGVPTEAARVGLRQLGQYA